MAEPGESEDDAALTCPAGTTFTRRDGGATQMCVLDGAVHGEFARFGPDGERLELAHYEHGLLEGAYSVWDASGTPRIEGRFQQGARAGKWRWYTSDGALWVESDGPNFVEFHPGGQPRFVHDDDGDRAFATDGSAVPLEDYVMALASVPVRPNSVDGSLSIMMAQSPAERVRAYAPPDSSSLESLAPPQTCSLARRVRAPAWPIADDLEVSVTVSHRYPLPPLLGVGLRPTVEALHSSVGQLRLSMLGALSELPGLTHVSGPACVNQR